MRKKLIAPLLQKAGRKLANRRGESIAEALAGFLIVVLALTILAGAITSGARVMKNASVAQTGSDQAMEAFWSQLKEEPDTVQEKILHFESEEGISFDLPVKIKQYQTGKEHTAYESFYWLEGGDHS